MSSLRKVAVATVLASSMAWAQAVPIVATGAGDPINGEPWTLSFDPIEGQALAVTFDLNESFVIESIQGWIGGGSGQVRVELVSGAKPTGAQIGIALFDALPTYGWQGLNGLSWAVGPGAYTVNFVPLSFSGVMPGGAPNPLAVEWFLADPTSFGWEQFDDLNVGVLVTAATPVPEPATVALLGLGLVGLGLRRRRAAFSR